MINAGWIVARRKVTNLDSNNEERVHGNRKQREETFWEMRLFTRVRWGTPHLVTMNVINVVRILSNLGVRLPTRL